MQLGIISHADPAFLQSAIDETNAFYARYPSDPPPRLELTRTEAEFQAAFKDILTTQIAPPKMPHQAGGNALNKETSTE